ncbi:MAG: hypothetical protein J6C44_04850 [Muribaculaceae bacterium]|nr:hypothetical protein [Muribaculaceae bacterium]
MTTYRIYSPSTATVTADGNVISGIDDISTDSVLDIYSPQDIYNLQGICIKHSATQADIDALSPGIYIIARKKVLVR